MSQRPAAVAGYFYPENPVELSNLLDRLLEDAPEISVRPRIVIAPHAGYIYSGRTAAYAYKSLIGSGYRRVLLVGPSHHVSFMGFAFSDADGWKTPLGEVPLDQRSVEKFLKNNPEIPAFLHPQPHEKEHSLEVQVPFLQKTLGEFTLIPLVYGRSEPGDLQKILDEETLIVISSDLSHFYDQTKANALDRQCNEAVEQMDPSRFGGCEACGKIGIHAALLYGKVHGLSATMLDYRTSGDVIGDFSSVVGYGSYLLYESDE